MRRRARCSGASPSTSCAARLAPSSRSASGRVRPSRAELFDLKTEDFYRKQTLSHLEPVLDTLRWIRAKTSVWLEVTTLLIPGLNDGDEEIRAECEWILGELGPDVPVHFTAFHPSFRMLDRPRTPPPTLARAREIGLERGLRHVYTGNVWDPEGQATRCPSCSEVLVTRDRFAAVECRIGPDGKCPRCATAIPGRWSVEAS